MDEPATAFDLGNAWLAQGDAPAAIAAFRRCLDLAPDRPATLFNLANAQSQAGQMVDGADTLLRCLRLAPDFADGYVNLAGLLLRLGLLDAALAMADAAVALLPAAPEALLCRAGILHHRAAYPAALAAYEAAIRLAPDHAPALSSLANTLHAMGRLEAARAMHDRAVALAPDDAASRFNRAATLLMLGHFAAGWRDFEWRWQGPGMRPRFATPPWRGEALPGRTILLHAEQGLGDTLQFVRYAPMVAARGLRVILLVQPALVRLLQGLPGVAAVCGNDADPPPCDAHCPLMSLPYAFGTRLDSIPAQTPYLHADPDSAGAWRARLSGPTMRVGLAWAGSPHRDWEARLVDRRRSLPPGELDALAGIHGVRFVSLQRDAAATACLEMVDDMAAMADFADTAALVAALDLVIAVDTAVAHLAAAMGRPVWLLSRYDGCWRWLHGRADSPWYPTMRIYRQATPHDWTTVIARVRHDLAGLAAAGVPVGASHGPV